MGTKQILNTILISTCAILTFESFAVAKKVVSKKTNYDRIVNTSPQNPWPRIKAPKEGAFNIIGFYTGGCFSGGSTLKLSGSHHEVMKPSRNRYYGHPQLIKLIDEIGAASGQKILVGDMSQPRGGPTPFGHASHQLGIEADIWYQPLSFFTPFAITPQQRETFEMTSVVSDDWKHFRPEKWTPATETVILRAASNPLVDRIFVNAVVKKYLCEKYPDFKALNKIRPWYFHNAHFHVRMKCPQGMSQCRNQSPVGPENGCDELAWWLSDRAIAVQDNANEDPVARVVNVPKACRPVAK